VPARGALSLPVAQWFSSLLDLSRAYRFGPAEHALVAARLLNAQGDVLARAFHFPEGLPARRERDIGLVAQAHIAEHGQLEVTLHARGFAQSVHFDTPGFVAEDEFFHLAPGTEQRVRLTPESADSPTPSTLGSVLALNTWTVTPLRMTS
jgi:beta-mannosidase